MRLAMLCLIAGVLIGAAGTYLLIGTRSDTAAPAPSESVWYTPPLPESRDCGHGEEIARVTEERDYFHALSSARARESVSAEAELEKLRRELESVRRAAEGAESVAVASAVTDRELFAQARDAFLADFELKENGYGETQFADMVVELQNCGFSRNEGAALAALYFQLTKYEHRRGLEPKIDFGDGVFETAWIPNGDEPPEFAKWDELRGELGFSKLCEKLATDVMGKEKCEHLRRACSYPQSWSAMAENEKVGWRVSNELSVWKRFLNPD